MATHAVLAACHDLAAYARANELTEADGLLMEILALLATVPERRKRLQVGGAVPIRKVVWAVRQVEAPEVLIRRPVHLRLAPEARAARRKEEGEAQSGSEPSAFSTSPAR